MNRSSNSFNPTLNYFTKSETTLSTSARTHDNFMEINVPHIRCEDGDESAMFSVGPGKVENAIQMIKEREKADHLNKTPFSQSPYEVCSEVFNYN